MLLHRCVLCGWFLLSSEWTSADEATATKAIISHPPRRQSLPMGDRPLGTGPTDFVDSQRGDDATQANDYRPIKGSPALDAGIAIPAEWPDPLRDSDSGKPDIGAFPVGVERWRVGP